MPLMLIENNDTNKQYISNEKNSFSVMAFEMLLAASEVSGSTCFHILKEYREYPHKITAKNFLLENLLKTMVIITEKFFRICLSTLKNSTKIIVEIILIVNGYFKKLIIFCLLKFFTESWTVGFQPPRLRPSTCPLLWQPALHRSAC